MPASKKHTALVVDDDASVRTLLKRQLSELKLAVVDAPDGETALEYVQQPDRAFSMMFCDQNMPGLKGHEFFQQARELLPDAIRVLVTGYDNMDDFIANINFGAIDYCLKKPWNISELADIVRIGLKTIEDAKQHARLLSIAKSQNTKLYSLGCELRRCVESHYNKSAGLDQRLNVLAKLLEKERTAAPLDVSSITSALDEFMSKSDMKEDEILSLLYRATLSELFEEFCEIVERNRISLSMCGGKGD
tara:strand:+ start:565 stop:1308 length:744 start_codon:yes stop_codon:yes gene_type:complete